MSRITDLRNAIALIAKVLSEKSVKVIQAGSMPKVLEERGNFTIYIPYLPDNASEELVAATQGFIDHEVAHVLFSDFDVVRSVTKSGPPALFILLNILEDIRIESAMKQKFLGSGVNLQNSLKLLLEKYLPDCFEKIDRDNPGEVFGAIIMPMFRSWAGDADAKAFMADKWKLAGIQDICTAVSELTPQIAEMRSTSDAAELAIKFFEAIYKPEEKSDPEGAEDEDPEEGEGEKSEAEEDEPEDGDEGSESESESEEGESEKPDIDEQESDPGEEELDQEPGEEPSTDEEIEDETDEQDGEAEEEESDEEEESSPGSGEEMDSEDDEEISEQSEPSSGVLDPGDVPILDLEEAFKTLISESVGEALSGSTGYIPYSTDFDTLEVMEVDEGFILTTAKHYQEFIDVDSQGGSLAKHLERSVRAQSKTRWEGGKRSGAVNPSALYKLKASSGMPAVFRKKQIQESKDAVFQLVIDLSASMYMDPSTDFNYRYTGTRRIDVALKCAYAIATALNKMKKPCEIVGFTTNGSIPEYRSDPMFEKFSRFDRLRHVVFKGFSDPFTATIGKRLYAGTQFRLDQNIDGESIAYFAKRLLARKESKKIQIVFSDGQPASSYETERCYDEWARHLIETNKQIKKAGIEQIGIGIQTSQVRHFYEKSVVVNSLPHLAETAIGEIAKALL
jgi:cobalamin biosynthesis protein CobT